MIPAEAMFELGARRFKLVQTAVDTVELYYVASPQSRELSRETAQKLVDCYLSPALRVTPLQAAEIPREPGGKYLMHESRI